MGKYHGHPRLVVSIKFAIGQAQLIEQIQVEGVALGHPVQAQQQDMALEFTADAAAAGLIHGCALGRREGFQTKGLELLGESFKRYDQQGRAFEK